MDRRQTRTPSTSQSRRQPLRMLRTNRVLLPLLMCPILSLLLGTLLQIARMMQLISDWQQKALPSTLTWRTRYYLSSISWLGPLRPHPPLDPLLMCGMYGTQSWWPLLLRPVETRRRLGCLREQMRRAEEEHVAFMKKVQKILFKQVFGACVGFVLNAILTLLTAR